MAYLYKVKETFKNYKMKYLLRTLTEITKKTRFARKKKTTDSIENGSTLYHRTFPRDATSTAQAAITADPSIRWLANTQRIGTFYSVLFSVEKKNACIQILNTLLIE